MSPEPDADEQRIRHWLHAHGVGHAPQPDPDTDPIRDRDPDWWDALYADEPTAPKPRRRAPRLPDWWRDKPEHLPTDDAEDDAPTSTDTDPDEPPPTKPDPEPARARPWRHQHPAHQSTRSPRQSLAEAWDSIPPRARWLAYHATAAYLGWELGLVDWSTYVTAWIAQTGFISPQAAFWYAAALATVALYRRTRHWWWPVAWLTAIPASSALAGVLLYAPHP